MMDWIAGSKYSSMLTQRMLEPLTSRLLAPLSIVWVALFIQTNQVGKSTGHKWSMVLSHCIFLKTHHPVSTMLLLNFGMNETPQKIALGSLKITISIHPDMGVMKKDR